MSLGQRLLQARQEKGLSQRQLCGEKISRNMLSQIENGAARPSMETLRYLAGQLEKPISWFLEEDTTPMQQRLLDKAEQAMNEGRKLYAQQLLQQAANEEESSDEQRRRLLLTGRLYPEKAAQVAKELPSLDEELLLRARGALQQGDHGRCLALLSAMEGQEGEEFYLLSGRARFAMEDYAGAAEQFLKVEDKALPQLEHCYEQLGDYKMAYYYAKKQ